MALSPQQKFLKYIQVTGVALERAEKQAADQAEQAQKIAELIPQAVEALVRHGRIEPHQKEAAARLLIDPVKALDLLIKTAAHRNAD